MCKLSHGIINAKEMVSKVGGHILYLSKFGSHLYGLNTEKSDIDLKGVYLPSYKKLLTSDLTSNHKVLNYTSGGDHDKNTSDDIDIQLWSLQHWFRMIENGDTGALDLLYSFTNKDVVLIQNRFIDSIFNDPLKFFNPSKTSSYTQYALGQARVYGVKGTRLGKIKEIRNFLNNINELSVQRFGELFDDVISRFGDPSYCFKKEIPNVNKKSEDALVICSKTYMNSAKFIDVRNRINNEYNKYGERSALAEKNEGIDWKALSHAVRACIQMKMLFSDGKICFPFKDENFNTLKDIKAGTKPYKEVESVILTTVNEVDELQKIHFLNHVIDYELRNSIILNCYKELEGVNCV